MKHIKIFENFEEGYNYEGTHEGFEFDSFEFEDDYVNEAITFKDMLGAALVGPLYWTKEIHQKSKDLWNDIPVLSKVKDSLLKKGAVTMGAKAAGAKAGSGAKPGPRTTMAKKGTLSPKEFDTKVIESILDGVKDRGEALMTIRNYVSGVLKLSMVNKKTKKEVSYDQWKKEMLDWKKEREAHAKKEASHKGTY